MIILFGSYVKENSKKDSDIDIYVEARDTKVKSNLQELNSGLSIKIGELF